MQIVIDIPEKEYLRLKEPTALYWDSILYKAIANGIPLPKGHGRLKDEKVAYRKFYARCLAEVAAEVFADTPTIVEADKEGAEE